MTTAHTSRAHARLAPSSAYRWMACPGSVRLSEGISEKSSIYAAEGTAAHELAALCLTRNVDPESLLDARIDLTPDKPGDVVTAHLPDSVRYFLIDEEMVESVRLYIDTVRSLIPKRNDDYELDVEQRLDMTHIHGEIFGTGDALVYQARTGWLHVLDFKYGKGVAVEVQDNPQLMLYGAGAARRYHNRVLNGITLHIVQPRAPHVHGPVRSWQTDPLTLMEFEDDLRAAALATEQTEAPLAAGEWCRFCRAFPTCPAARERSVSVAIAGFGEAPTAPEKLDPGRLAEVLKEAEFIGNWVKAVQVFAHNEAVAGRPLPGFKLVAKRASRKWKDVEAATDVLMFGHNMSEDDVYTPRELRSPSAVEKIVGKKAFAPIEKEMVVKVSSGTNLVLDSDPRPAVKADGASEFAAD